MDVVITHAIAFASGAFIGACTMGLYFVIAAINDEIAEQDAQRREDIACGRVRH